MQHQNPGEFAGTAPGTPPILAPIGLLGRTTLELVGDAGRATLFLGSALLRVPKSLRRVGAVFESLFFVGNRSMLVIALTAGFTGLVLALQGYNALARFGAEQMVGALVALSLTRELGPVLGALMVTARAGSAIAATLGNMRVTEQVDALRTMAIDPLDFLVAPRIVAALIAVPLLTCFFIVLGIGAAQVFSSQILGMEGSQFMTSARDALTWSDVYAGLVKSVVFAVLLVWISTYRGYHASGGAKGVGLATTRAVVEVSVLVLASDYILTAFLF